MNIKSFDDQGPFSRLMLERLVLHCFLGVGEVERASPQAVEIDLELRFLLNAESSILKACRGDHYDQALCYAKLSAWAQATTESKSYFLIEHLAYEIYLNIIEKIRTQTTVEYSGLRVKVRKQNLPMPYTVDSASFEVCSWPIV